MGTMYIVPDPVPVIDVIGSLNSIQRHANGVTTMAAKKKKKQNKLYEKSPKKKTIKITVNSQTTAMRETAIETDRISIIPLFQTCHLAPTLPIFQHPAQTRIPSAPISLIIPKHRPKLIVLAIA
jgi:hypothetical protein